MDPSHSVLVEFSLQEGQALEPDLAAPLVEEQI
jgi:hypothetical protein